MILELLLSVMALTPVLQPADSVAGQETVLDTATVQDTLVAAPVPLARSEIDQRLGGELAAIFDRIPGLEGVGVRVEAGVVFLTGTALSTGDRALADSLAQGMSGVLHVDNRIAEETSIGLRLRPMFRTLEEKLIEGISYLPLLLVALVLVLLFLFVARLIYRWEGLFKRLSRNPFLRNLLRQMAAGVVGVFGVFLALELLDATALVGAILGAAGVMGIAVGFAFRNIAENYLAGIILSIRQPFYPDDHILIEGQEGKVIRLTSRETLLMTLDGNHVRIPNATIFNSVIQNYTRNPLRRFRFELSVGQSEDLTRVQEIGLSVLRGMEGILDDPAPRVIIGDVGDSWVLIRFFGWVDQAQAALDKARGEAIRLTKEALDTAGVAMPAPEYGVRFLGDQDVPTLVKEGADEMEGLDMPLAASMAESPPTSPLTTDLGPDRALDEQIARDREETKERDLLEPTS